MLSRVLSFPRFTQFHNVFLLRIKCLFIKQIKTNREPSNAATFASALTYTTTALPVVRLAREDDPCVTFETPCQVCTSFSDEQLKKIQNRKRYLKKQKAETSSKDDELDLLGQRSKLGFYVPFNSHGHIGTGPQNCHLWDLNPQS